MKKRSISDLRQYFEEKLDKHVLELDAPLEMVKPMLYSLKNGGKRLRPLMLLMILDIYGKASIKDGLATAIALEYIHTYSLIHDDLPAMDNDDLRRGQPTNHIQFNEATAILAGDALLTDAFALVANDKHLKAKQKVKLVSLLSQAAGSSGMVAGQLYDVQAQDQKIDLNQLKHIHQLKTGQLFMFSVRGAAIIGDFSKEETQLIESFGESFGLAYQIHNDLMDVVACKEETGKTQGRDEDLEKATYPALLGLEESKAALEGEIKEMQAKIAELEEISSKPFASLLSFLEYINIEV